MCVCACQTCAQIWETPAPGPAEGLSWAACKSPGCGKQPGCRVGGMLVAWVLEGPAGSALRTVGHAAGEGGARIRPSHGCLSSCCLLCMSRA